MESTKILDIAGIASFFLGSVVFLLTYLRAAISKSNRDIDRNTITTYESSNKALTEERDMWKARALDAEGQNKVLQNTVTAAPQIAQLTNTITKHQAENSKSQKQTTKLLADLLREIKTLVEKETTA